MAKSKSGGTRSFIRGSVGSETYSIGLDGKGKKQQVIRAKAVEVANPRTRAQAAQRMKLLPITFARQILSDIVNHSFKGIPTGSQSLQYFVGINLKETDVPYQTKGSLNREIGGYTIAEGTLADLRPEFGVLTNAQSMQNGLNVPFLSSLKLPVESSQNGYVANYADFCKKLLVLNPWLKEGDEIATIVFTNTLSGSNHGINVVKHRMIIDSSFTEETPIQFSYKAADAQESDRKYFNALYALAQWNEDIYDHLDSYIEAVRDIVHSTRGNGTIIMSYMGWRQDKDNHTTYLSGFPVDYDFVNDYGHIFSVEEAFKNNVMVAFASVVSRFENGTWDFTTSDICLDYFYLQAVSSEARLDAAIASYMAGDIVRAGQDQFFLRLDDGNTIPAAPLTIRAGVGTGNYTSMVNVQGYTDPATGKKYAVINDDNKILQYVGGPVVKGPVTLEETGDMSVDNWKSPVDVIFIKEADVLSSN